MRNKNFILTVLIFVFNYFLYASTGKISGKIINNSENEPMIGVNILIKEIGIGSVSDNEGEYIISNIPPGVYTIEATYIGYTKIILKDILINQGRTSYQNITMKEEAIKGEEIIVTANRPMVYKDLTAFTQNYICQRDCRFTC